MWKFNVVGAQLNSLPVFATRERFFVVSSLLSPYSHHMPLNRLNVSVLGALLSHSWRVGCKKEPPKNDV